ncbi:neurogenic locus notch homolog protein 4-like [Thalassophryne amazonica]|uniref:neurogenic locus notch homolog protein 4-like n=1 Tax=Thalassophryne amazonica TaxID=390379 RepID=UPI0014720DC8|nr:neurogenic locus notch homolog protein 4-like [Thalassophryne amazonica]
MHSFHEEPASSRLMKSRLPSHEELGSCVMNISASMACPASSDRCIYEGSAECSPCLQCHYCSNETTSEEAMLSIMVCPTGFLCSQGLARDPQRSATLCPQGFYCPGGGIGFYCAEGSSSPEPCPEGTYGSRPALGDASECSPCGGGQYCAGVGLTAASGTCKERFYCREGAKSATPSDGLTGGLCPPGSYCPHASSSPLPCPAGTFSSSTGLRSLQECITCPPGFYCLGSNNTSPSGPCFPGYYCTGGSPSPVQNEAEEGYYTLKGAVKEEPCPLGTFQPRRRSQSCIECQNGRLCNQTGLSHPPLCPTGHYCSPGSSVPHPCPPGSYSDQPGGDTMAHCRPCEAGWFCKRPGLSDPEGLCDPGHYCTSGASTASPVGVASGSVCPAGFICPRGTRYPEQYPCPLGTWSNSVGAKNFSSCWLCPSGLYCNRTGLSQPSGSCDAGYYCSGGAVTATPSGGLTGDVCPVGHFCPIGSSSPIVCPDGTHSNFTGAAECDDCPPGTYCLSGESVQLCPAGHYCLGGGVAGILPCPPGTYSPHVGLSQVEQCLICPAGFYCEDWGLFEPSGRCQAGFYCRAGVNFPNPDGNFSTGVGGVCPKGKFCPEGTSVPSPCPLGTYSSSLYLPDSSGCSPCPAGQFCSSAGLTQPSGPCQAGFYCPGGDATPTAK